MKKILIDSGPLIALFDQNDAYHQKSIDFIKNNRHELVTTIAVITEVLHLLDFSTAVQINFLHWVTIGGVTIEPITNADLQRITELTTKYADLPMDFADASLVFLGEALNISEIATIDRDFDIYRMNGKMPFTIYVK